MKISDRLKNKIALLILLIAIMPTFLPLLRSGYFPMHDDVQAMRTLQMDKCVRDLQIPCRWVPDMGYGFGYPQFNYYSPLPYYLMETFHLVGLGILDSVKAFFVFVVIVAMTGMFYLGKAFWGTKGGILSALFYSYAPYLALDLYVRGAVGELTAIAILPYIFLFIKEIIEGQKNSIIWLTLSFAALLTSHNITAVFFIPTAVLWFIYLGFFYFKLSPTKYRNFFKKFILSTAWGLAIAGFFILPALFEKQFVKVETLTYGYFNFVSHFVGLKQLLFSTFWGYGSSEPGPYDQSFLGIGIFHWLLPFLSLILLWYFRKKKSLLLVASLTLTGWLAVFMIHPRSVFIWNRVHVLSYFQFPWRFLMLVIFLFSFAIGSLGITFPKSKSFVIGIFIALYLFLIIFYASYFRPSKWYEITDAEKFSGESWQLQQTVSINDYLPIYAKKAPDKAASAMPEILEGDAEIWNAGLGSNWQRWKINVEGDSALVQLQLFYFPGWKVWVDGNLENINYDNDRGLITLSVASGEHDIYAKLVNTPIRNFGNLVTLIGLLAIPLYIKGKKL